jgi:ubiquinone/menaquinone biosynthesis C-methylase UbiE
MEDIFTFISSLQVEMNRLQCQAEELSPLASESIEKCGISEGMTVADVGCGTGHVSFLVSNLVGPTGGVIGIDANPSAIELCRKTASSNEVKNVSFIVGNACDLSADISDNSVDVAYSRFLLTHLQDPFAAIREMIRITTLKGMIMIEDCDLTRWIVEPDDRYVNVLWKWYEGIIRKKGGDPTLGRKLYQMFIQQGLDPKVDVYSLPVTKNNNKIWNSIIDVLNKIDEMGNTEDVINIGDNYLSHNSQEFTGETKRSFSRPREEMQRPFKLRDLVNGLSSFMHGEYSLFVFPPIFRIWARKS